MRKLICVFMCLVCFVLVVNANTVVFEDDFNETDFTQNDSGQVLIAITQMKAIMSCKVIMGIIMGNGLKEQVRFTLMS